MSGKGIILVTGATGQQGVSAVRQLVDRGWTVRALVRDASRPFARLLAKTGVEVVQGDMDDYAALAKTMQRSYGVFSVQYSWRPGVGPAGDVLQGKQVAEAARASGVKHIVYCSSGGADRDSGLPRFDSKWQVEEHIRALDLPATVFRPAMLMDNFNWMRPEILSGVFSGFPLEPETRLQLVAAQDIGVFAALAFEKPGQFMGKAIEIAGDELTEPEIAAVFSRVIGRPVQYAGESASGEGSGDAERRQTIRWFNDQGYRADIPALRALHPELMDLEQYLRRNGWENAGQLPM